MLNLDQAMQSLDNDVPSGEDLAYDPSFDELTRVNQPGEERVIGDSVIEASDPDYHAVARMAETLLGQSRDIRIAVLLANAVLRTTGLSAFETVLRYVRDGLEHYWDSVHPQLDPEDDDDPTMRVNAVLGLADGETVLRALRLAPLTDSRALGRFCLRDMQAADGDFTVSNGGDSPPDRQLISAAFADTPQEGLAELGTAVAQCLDHVAAISDIFDEKVGVLGPDLDPLRKILTDVQRRLPACASDPVEEGVLAEAPEPNASAARTPQAVVIPGALQSPTDVQASIDSILAYYARHEPSSPLPLLLRRARRLVSADFVTIMQDLAPLGMENVSLIGGFDPDADDLNDHPEI